MNEVSSKNALARLEQTVRKVASQLPVEERDDGSVHSGAKEVDDEDPEDEDQEDEEPAGDTQVGEGKSESEDSSGKEL